MATAGEARDWARGALRGIGDSLYTPFCGTDGTDIALGMFNSPSSGYVLTPDESARIAEAIPAVCATKEGAFRPAASRRLHELAPYLAVWECDTTVYRAGWLRDGIVCPAQLGTA